MFIYTKNFAEQITMAQGFENELRKFVRLAHVNPGICQSAMQWYFSKIGEEEVDTDLFSDYNMEDLLKKDIQVKIEEEVYIEKLICNNEF